MGVHIQYMPTNVVYEGYVHGYVLRCQDFIFSTYVLENDFDQKPSHCNGHVSTTITYTWQDRTNFHYFRITYPERWHYLYIKLDYL